MAPPLQYFAWKIPWTAEPGGLQSMGLLESDTTERLHFHFSFSCFGEGNGNPLQCSCLENPKDRGAWWAAVYGVAQSRTRLKRLSSSRYWSYKVETQEQNARHSMGSQLGRSPLRGSGRVPQCPLLAAQPKDLLRLPRRSLSLTLSLFLQPASWSIG